jgi:plasmid stabilization system protein ParE
LEFDVEITQTALDEAEEYVLFIRHQQQDPLAAECWWNGLIKAILSLETIPQRHPAIPERRYFSEEMRQIIYFSHRIIFSITRRKVTVLRIYHGSRQSLR